VSRIPLFRASARGLAALAIGSAALLTTTFVDRAGLSFSADGFVPRAEAQAACARPSMGLENAILTAAEESLLSSGDMDIVAYTRLQRVEGDWARVVVVPRIETDHALLILQKDKSGVWKVIAGPGTAFGPEDMPGAPKAILDACPL
jgi:hypothetical protein